MVTINLLPTEVTKKQAEQQEFSRVQFVSVVILIILILFACSTFVLRIFQTKQISDISDQLKSLQENVLILQNRESALTILKNRLVTIGELFGIPSKQRVVYNLINTLLPQTIVISSIIVNRSGEVSLSVTTSDSLALSDFVSNLLLKEKNEDKIAQVSIESLNLSKDGVYRASFKIKAKS